VKNSRQNRPVRVLNEGKTPKQQREDEEELKIIKRPSPKTNAAIRLPNRLCVAARFLPMLSARAYSSKSGFGAGVVPFRLATVWSWLTGGWANLRHEVDAWQRPARRVRRRW
jgi:hypothetical protein